MKKMFLAAMLLTGCLFAVQAQESQSEGTGYIIESKGTKIAQPVSKNAPAAKAEKEQPAKTQEEAVLKTAKQPQMFQIEKPKPWDFFQLGFWFGIPPQTEYSDVYGIRVGVPFCGGQGHVYGVETAIFCGGTDYVNGVQACIMVSKSKKVVGFQGAIVTYADEVEGLQLGILNMAKNKSFQLGIINYIENGTIPFMPVINFRF
ncbi:MAG: hypothetical protein GY750_20170 [Lentisphaerae bacterium]|nr:hypothetical protein [Lentisphaerota bacterium]MCP4103711.1 hypothetical protein [Lentisphaerota bacterium]